MDGEVGLAGGFQRSDLGVALERLQRVAGSGLVATVVDQQRRPPVVRDPRADRGAQGRLRRRDLDHGARLGLEGRLESVGRRGQAERQPALCVEADAPLRPSFSGAHELARGQAVQQFVGDQDQGGARRDLVQRRDPAGSALGQPALLQRPQRPARLDQPQLACGEELGDQPRRPQRVEHQGPVAGAHLHQAEGSRPAQPIPDLHGPQADQFPEHLRDLGRGDEVALLAQLRPRGVVAVGPVVQAERHVLGHGQRSRLEDPLPKTLRQAHRRAGGTSPGRAGPGRRCGGNRGPARSPRSPWGSTASSPW